jgi:3,4-dihydroxy-2-butanone 4-phosphate synthase
MRGRIVILVDDEDRENEADLVFSQTSSSLLMLNFMARFGVS